MNVRLAAAGCAVTLAAATPPITAAPLAMYGTGTMSPGVPLTGCVTGLTLEFTGTAVPNEATTFQGASRSCATLQLDQGTGSFSGGYSGTVTYRRTLFKIDFTGPGIAAQCLMTPTSMNPWTTYVIVCGPGLTAH